MKRAGGVSWVVGVGGRTVLVASVVVSMMAGPALAQSLKGSHASLLRQRRSAHEHDFTFLRTTGDVRRLVSGGYLVAMRGDRNYELEGVSFPYARPEVSTFVTRLAAQYRSACGERLVVTSLTRPITRQPRNASPLSVHPTGMALDLRRSPRSSCRSWLERTLLSLERAGVLEATRENYPPHYHVAVFPQPYVRYVAQLEGEAVPEPKAVEAVAVAEAAADQTGLAVQTVAMVSVPETANAYQVRPGDSLWTIAKETGVTVDLLKRANNLRSARIRAGKTLVIPATAEAAPGQIASVSGGDGESQASDFTRTYRVRRGDSLWSIAREAGISVESLKKANGLRSSRIKPDRTLIIPPSQAS